MLRKINRTWREFPPKFWIIVLATFIDAIGATLIFPFFALYITARFKIGMTQTGVLLGLFFISSLVGSMVGGALTGVPHSGLDRSSRNRTRPGGLDHGQL